MINGRTYYLDFCKLILIKETHFHYGCSDVRLVYYLLTQYDVNYLLMWLLCYFSVSNNICTISYYISARENVYN